MITNSDSPAVTSTAVTVGNAPVSAQRFTAGARYLGGIVALALAYYTAGQASLAVQYTGPVAAIWLPAGVAAAALYFAGLRHWPAVVIGDLALADMSQPVGTALAITAGNLADVIVIAVLMRRLIGPRADLDRLEHVSGVLVAIAAGASITATVAVVSMRAGGIVQAGDVPALWRSWSLADASGSLVVIPLALAWMQPRSPAWRGRGAWEGFAMVATVVVLSTVALSRELELTYVVFPALIWAALRFGAQGATLGLATAAAMTVTITAREEGAFTEQPITDSALSTQLYIAVAAITTMFLAASVAERRRSAEALAEAKRREGQRAADERKRIARDLHDSVSQSLFSTALHVRSAERALADERVDPAGPLAKELGRVKQLTGAALAEMRALVFELRPRALAEDGLVVALEKHASAVSAREELPIVVDGPHERLPVALEAEEQLYRVTQEALANVIKHASASAARITVSAADEIVEITISDDGRGFRPDPGLTEGFGLRSMRARVAEFGGDLEIASTPLRGTLVRARVPARALRSDDR